MGYAVRAGYIAVNPCSQVEPPRKDTPETKWLNPADAASLMIAEGLPIRDVAARLGHSQTSTTLDIYATP